MDSENIGGNMITDIVTTAQTVGTEAKKAIIWNKIMEITKFAVIIIAVLIVVYFIYKMVMRRK